MSNPPAVAIDIFRGRDLALALRAVSHDWTMPPEQRQQLIEQLPGAIDAAKEDARRMGTLMKLARELGVSHPLVEAFVPVPRRQTMVKRPRRRTVTQPAF